MIRNRQIFSFALITGLLLFSGVKTLAHFDHTPTPDSAKTLYFFGLSSDERTLFSPDTTLDGIQRYNPLYAYSSHYITTGNIGHPHLSILYEPTYKSGFYFGMHPFDHFYLKTDSIRFYKTATPYTHLFYIMGSKMEQTLNITHAQKVTHWFSLNLDFDYVNSPGYYKRQRSDDKNFTISGQFKTRNNKYHALAGYLHNKITIRENGGITYDSVFEKNIITNRESISVNLNTAENKLKENNIFIKQTFLPGKTRNPFTPDSLKAGRPFGFIPTTISHTFLLTGFTRSYAHSESDHPFYSFVHDSINPTFDSVLIRQIRNNLTISNATNHKDQKLLYAFGLTHQYTELSGYAEKRFFSLLIPSFTASLIFSRNISTNIHGNFTVGDFYGGDYQAGGILKIQISPFDLAISAKRGGYKGDYFLHFYQSNHFMWEKSFARQVYDEQSLETTLKGYSITLKRHRIQDLIFLDTNAVAAQYNKPIDIHSLIFQKKFRYRSMSAAINGALQEGSVPGIFPLPALVANISIYYTQKIFKNAAIIQPGADFYYYSSYQGYAYMPALSAFYPQTLKETGNYLYSDLFLNLKIKRARLFLKYQNLGALIGQTGYYTVPSYPMPDGGLRFGISWMFYD